MATEVVKHGRRWRVRWRLRSGQLQTFSAPERHTAARFKLWLESCVDERDVPDTDERIAQQVYLNGAVEDGAVTLVTLSEALIAERLRDGHIGPSSVAGYRDRIKRYGILGTLPFEALTEDLIREHIAQLRTQKRDGTGRPYATNTVRETVDYMRQVGAWALRKKRVSDNPFADIFSPALPSRKEDKFLTRGEYAQLRKHGGGVLGDMCDVMVATGCRIGEVLGLRINDLVYDGEYHTVRIDETYLTTNAYGPTKNRETRTIDVDPDTAAILHRYADGRPGEDPVFTHFSGVGPMPYGTFSSGWDRMVVRASKAGVTFPKGTPTPHWLRHTHAAWMLATNECSLYELSERLGHSSIIITADMYGHLDPAGRIRIQRALTALGSVTGRVARVRLVG